MFSGSIVVRWRITPEFSKVQPQSIVVGQYQHMPCIVAIGDYTHGATLFTTQKSAITISYCYCWLDHVGSATVSFGLGNSFPGAKTPQTVQQNWVQVIRSAYSLSHVEGDDLYPILIIEFTVIEKQIGHGCALEELESRGTKNCGLCMLFLWLVTNIYVHRSWRKNFKFFSHHTFTLFCTAGLRSWWRKDLRHAWSLFAANIGWNKYSDR